jgi:hypothetical protein
MDQINAFAILCLMACAAGCGDTPPETIESAEQTSSTRGVGAGQSAPGHARALCRRPHRPEPADDAATPGDDRPGFVACGAGACGPGDRCCDGEGTCLGARPYCESEMDPGSVCDGPEDCPGNGCYNTKYGDVCGTGSGRFAVLCHTDDDCPRVDCPVIGGACPVCTAIGFCSAQ